MLHARHRHGIHPFEIGKSLIVNDDGHCLVGLRVGHVKHDVIVDFSGYKRGREAVDCAHEYTCPAFLSVVYVVSMNRRRVAELQFIRKLQSKDFCLLFRLLLCDDNSIRRFFYSAKVGTISLVPHRCIDIAARADISVFTCLIVFHNQVKPVTILHGNSGESGCIVCDFAECLC
ncbi:hypothetical protein SDC9_163150 [bioreactor metagenome]|uniref:Uncharacterized protein n=1 Tax=bioreactor metagenome TaxID=1076179 RepID=A0A645FUX0_9ZZZZ